MASRNVKLISSPLVQKQVLVKIPHKKEDAKFLISRN
jgi:hypothetical protein